MRQLAVAGLMALLPLNVAAEELCPGQRVDATPDGRLLGHISYAQARMTDLAPAPAGFALAGRCLVRPEVAADLARLLAAAALSPEVKGRIRAVSCYRSVSHQRHVFCSKIGPRKAARDAVERARFVGPPGYSEHATGYALDFGTRPSPGCADTNACFARTAAGRWLIQHASEYGFELSFPAGNGQGVSYEPWHWRWVGSSATAPGAAAARALFARARASYPAAPMVNDNPARSLLPVPGFQSLPK